ncbi:hypothetical protein ACEPAG_3605 [Sanghuangporus baumii]
MTTIKTPATCVGISGEFASGLEIPASHTHSSVTTLTSVNQIAMEIATGEIDIGIGAGVESMTLGYGLSTQPARFSDKILETQEAEDCLIPMGITSENVAKEFNITREVQDAFAAESFRRAAAAQKAGKFVSEIAPVTVKQIDPKTEEGREVVVDSDDGIRDDVTAASLAKLKPAFSEDGSTHAGKPLRHPTEWLQSYSRDAQWQTASASLF